MLMASTMQTTILEDFYDNIDDNKNWYEDINQEIN